MVVFFVPVALILVHLSAKSVLALPVLPDDVDARERPWSTMFLPYKTLHHQTPWLEELLGPHPRPHHAPGTLPRLQEPSGTRPRPQRTSEARLQPRDTERASTWSLGEKGDVPSKKSGERRPSDPQQETPGVLLPLQRLRQVKRTEGPKTPTVGLGVLSDLGKFFTELRTNLDSVEALAQEQGAAGLHPEDLLALLAKEEARSQALAGLSNENVPQGFSVRSLMLGAAPNDQRYANSGLGK